MAERTTTYLHTDGLGSVVAASDEDGNVLWRKSYAPYGTQIDEQEDDQKLSYTGKPHDEGLGLTYFGARWYDPQAGRFTGIDPVGFKESNPQSFNRYAYANNNPYKFIDPDGREAKVVIDGSNITITLPIKYTGAGATPDVIKKFNDGIEKEWTGQFGRFTVETNVTSEITDGLINTIEVPEGNGRAKVVKSDRNNEGTWPAERPAWTAAHEAGHLMGLGDRYDKRTNQVEAGWDNNIMGKTNKSVDHRNIIGIKKSEKNKVIEK